MFVKNVPRYFVALRASRIKYGMDPVLQTKIGVFVSFEKSGNNVTIYLSTTS